MGSLTLSTHPSPIILTFATLLISFYLAFVPNTSSAAPPPPTSPRVPPPPRSILPRPPPLRASPPPPQSIPPPPSSSRGSPPPPRSVSSPPPPPPRLADSPPPPSRVSAPPPPRSVSPPPPGVSTPPRPPRASTPPPRSIPPPPPTSRGSPPPPQSVSSPPPPSRVSAPPPPRSVSPPPPPSRVSAPPPPRSVSPPPPTPRASPPPPKSVSPPPPSPKTSPSTPPPPRKPPSSPTKESINFIIKSCNEIRKTYNQSRDCPMYGRCVDSLCPKYKTIGTSPFLLSKTSLSLSYHQVKGVATDLKASSHNATGTELSMLTDCVTDMKSAAAQLYESYEELKKVSPSMDKTLKQDLMNMVSGAADSENKCISSVEAKQKGMNAARVKAMEGAVYSALNATLIAKTFINEFL